jgi:hypothetical protein
MKKQRPGRNSAAMARTRLRNNDFLIRLLISKYAPTYEGELRPFTAKDITTLQYQENAAKAWQVMHLYWSGQREACTDRLQSLIQDVRKTEVPQEFYRTKRRLLRKMEDLQTSLPAEIGNREWWL